MRLHLGMLRGLGGTQLINLKPLLGPKYYMQLRCWKGSLSYAVRKQRCKIQAFVQTCAASKLYAMS